MLFLPPPQGRPASFAANTKGAPQGAPSSESICFFLTLLIPEYQIQGGNLDIFLNFLFVLFTITCKKFVVFYLLTRSFPIREQPLQQSHFEQNLAALVQRDRNLSANRLFVTMQDPRRIRQTMLLKHGLFHHFA